MELDNDLNGKIIQASGYYHKFNFLKFRVLDVLFKSPEPLTSVMISKITGVDAGKIQTFLYAMRLKKIPYIRRLPKKAVGKTNSAYRYKITKKGIVAYMEYYMRIQRGFDLNRLKTTPQRMETYGKFEVKKQFDSIYDFTLTPEQLAPYFGLNKKGGIEKGLKKDDLLIVSGIIRST